MPEMTLLGWFHTVMGVLAMALAIVTLVRDRVFAFTSATGRPYLWVTVVVAGSALGIYNQGSFNIAHILALLTLAAVLGGYLMERFQPVGAFSRYLQMLAYSATLLFHVIPAITDFLRRLPVGDPIIDSFEDPLLLQSYQVALVLWFCLLVAQSVWLRRNG